MDIKKHRDKMRY